MNRLLPLTIALFITVACFGQTVETVSERFHYMYVKPETKPTIEQIQKENETRQRNWQEEFDAMKASLDEGERVSDNVKLTVNTEVKFPDLIVSVAYETIKLSNEADDYALGKYTITSSNACMFMCNFLKEKMENDLADYLKPGTKVDVKVTGATDGTPIRSKIAYNGEYGDFNNRPVTLNGKPHKMTVTQKSGVTTNGQLAFLRTQGVEVFLMNQVAPLKNTQNTFEECAVENKEKGGGYRRVSVEIILHGAFADVEPEKTEKP
ncbi:MAG: hypothetical protein K6F96_02795 [Bacteroidales bacterium]|nr:hypothetical protein [Bacteroidales bacterium]